MWRACVPMCAFMRVVCAFVLQLRQADGFSVVVCMLREDACRHPVTVFAMCEYVCVGTCVLLHQDQQAEGCSMVAIVCSCAKLFHSPCQFVMLMNRFTYIRYTHNYGRFDKKPELACIVALLNEIHRHDEHCLRVIA